MMTKLVNLARKNKLLEIGIKVVVWVALLCISTWTELMGFIRVHGLLGKQYTDMKKLKDKYAGKRCFIICTGPSLTVEDLEKLKGEYTFGMNSICLFIGR